ncbi:hypothetical protein [Polycladomyces subterraneus]|uniref:Uncharacterized protein n=1 Tax=Polycladomyces subterraneus TaxID=1016997 RepID=A0ABT8IQ46_9BACL|nr:hypothetical protein [Polycladomyces subterraneus]MDN4594865.1 hypothetical protein [Polycladomyces subterraneus]
MRDGPVAGSFPREGPLDPFEVFGTVKQNVAALSAQVIEYGYGVFCM